MLIKKIEKSREPNEICIQNSKPTPRLRKRGVGGKVHTTCAILCRSVHRSVLEKESSCVVWSLSSSSIPSASVDPVFLFLTDLHTRLYTRICRVALCFSGLVERPCLFRIRHRSSRGFVVALSGCNKYCNANNCIVFYDR